MLSVPVNAASVMAIRTSAAAGSGSTMEPQEESRHLSSLRFYGSRPRQRVDDKQIHGDEDGKAADDAFWFVSLTHTLTHDGLTADSLATA
jgi:hypothetical protein